jgi:hypothetical protein
MQPPFHTLAEICFDPFEITKVIRSHKQLGVREGMARQGGQHGRTKHPVLDVPSLRPGIGKEQEDARQLQTLWKAIQELPYFGPDKPKIRQVRVTLLPERSRDPVPLPVNSEAELVAVGTCVGGEEVSVPTPKLKSDHRMSLHQIL